MKRIALFVGLMFVAICALAQYPDKAINILVPFPAGSLTDAMTRIVAKALEEKLGQPLIIFNKPGADGMIAGQEVVRARPDGYTLLITTGSQVAIPALHKNPPYDALKDLTPIGDIGRYTMALYVNPSVPAKTLKELIDYAKANPDKLNYATSSVSNIVATEEMNALAGIKMKDVRYKSAPQAFMDLVAGRVQVMWDTLTVGSPFVKRGELRMLALGASARSNVVPDVPTMAEAGMPKFIAPAFMGLAGPAKLPPEVVARINKELAVVLKRPDVIEAVGKHGFVFTPSTAAEFGEFLKSQGELHARLLKAAGVQPN